MANSCHNVLSVHGSEPYIARFKAEAKAEGTALSLNILFAMPRELEKALRSGDSPSGYDWRVENWGSKGDVVAIPLGEAEGYLEYEFVSPWCTPIKWMEKVSRDYPRLHFSLKYDEPGMGCMGVAKVSNGEVFDEIIEY